MATVAAGATSVLLLSQSVLGRNRRRRVGQFKQRSAPLSTAGDAPKPAASTSAPPPPGPPASGSSAAPGEGIRSLQTSSVFRTLNFELYARPNRYMMGIGAFAFVLCVSYIVVWSVTNSGERKTTYNALDDEDRIVTRQKRSRWD